MRLAAAVPAIGLLAGAAFGIVVPDASRPFGYLALACAGVGALAAWHGGRDRLLISFVAIGFAVGGTVLSGDAWMQASRPSLREAFDEMAAAERVDAVAEHRLIPEDASAFAIVEGTLRGDAAVGASGVSLSIDVDRIEHAATQSLSPRQVSGGVSIGVAGVLAADRRREWRAGRRVRLPAELHRPARYLDEGVPDAERASQLRGIQLVGSAKSGALVDVIAHASWVDERTADVRELARHVIDDNVGYWSARSAAVVKAIVIGDRAGLDEQVVRALQDAGTYHVIAISGGNIAILAGLILGTFRCVGLLGRFAMIASIAMLIAYANLVGGGASVNRATWMAVLYFGARVIDQRSPPMNALASVAAVQVVVQPLAIADPAFVLTFGATLAILMVGPLAIFTGGPLAKTGRWPQIVRAAVTLLAASCATEVMLLPVGALLFSRITFAGLALNFLAIPLMAVAQIAGMATVPAALASARMASLTGYVAHVGAAGLIWSADLVRFAPAMVSRVAPPTWPWVVAYYVGLFTWWQRPGRLVPLVAAGGCAIWIVAEPWTFVAQRGDGRLHVRFIDVGQGDSAFVRFPRGATLLVDAGGLVGSSSFDVGDRVVAPVLRQSGTRRLDHLVLTHGDPDHIGGAASIVREFRPRSVWEGVPVPRFAPLAALHDAAALYGLRWTNVNTGGRRTIDDVEVVVWNPDPPEWERQRVRNDDSVVIELRWNGVSVLLTGDIGKGIERRIGGAISSAPLRILKVPHHGSLTSSTPEFIRSIAPRIAVVSVGRANRFGHPVPEVLERYREAGVEVFRTDRDGEVTIDSDGHSIAVHAFSGRTYAVSAP